MPMPCIHYFLRQGDNAPEKRVRGKESTNCPIDRFRDPSKSNDGVSHRRICRHIRYQGTALELGCETYLLVKGHISPLLYLL